MMAEPIQDPSGVWDKATPLQLLKYLKLLGVEHHVIARQLGISPTAISLWVMGHRPVPSKYRPGLLRWAGVAWQQALERLQKEAQALPTPDLQRAALEAFYAPLHRWYLEVLHETGLLEERIRRSLRALGALATHEPLTASDLRDIVTLSAVVANNAQNLLDMQGVDDASTTQAQEGEG